MLLFLVSWKLNIIQLGMLAVCLTNNNIFDRGTILIAWLLGAFSVFVEMMTAPMVQLKVDPVGFAPWFYFTFVYGSNDRHEDLICGILL